MVMVEKRSRMNKCCEWLNVDVDLLLLLGAAEQVASGKCHSFIMLTEMTLTKGKWAMRGKWATTESASVTWHQMR